MTATYGPVDISVLRCPTCGEALCDSAFYGPCAVCRAEWNAKYAEYKPVRNLVWWMTTLLVADLPTSDYGEPLDRPSRPSRPARRARPGARRTPRR